LGGALFSGIFAKILSLVIIALSVLILGEVLTWDGSADILAFGLATSAGMAALSFVCLNEARG